MAFGVGFIFRLAAVRPWLKATLMVLPFVAIFADILAWFLTKWDPVYAYTVIAGGVLLGLAWAGPILIALYQLWFRKRPEEKPPFR